MSDPFIAEVKIFAGNFAPRGWAFCNGQLLPIAQNTALFSLIGTTFGGDGRTTTALPNLQGKTPMHPGRGPGLTSRRLGEQGGVKTVTLTEEQIASHSHTMNAFDGVDVSEPSTGYGPGSANMYNDVGEGVKMASNTLANAGDGQPHNNLQPYLTMNFIIALVGIYPSRS